MSKVVDTSACLPVSLYLFKMKTEYKECLTCTELAKLCKTMCDLLSKTEKQLMKDV